MVDRYCARTGDKGICAGSSLADERGFMVYTIEPLNGWLVIRHIYGDAKHWLTEANRIARESNCMMIMGAVKDMARRRLFERKYGFTLKGYILGREVEA
jgi:hypothetical protein